MDDPPPEDEAGDVTPDGPGDGPGRPPWEQRAATLLVRLAAVGLVVVVVSGVPLVWRYHPGDVAGLRAVHVLGSTLLLGAVGALVLVTIVAALRRRPAWTGWAAALAAFAAAGLGSFSGSVIAWDLIVVRAGTSGADLRPGALAPLSDGVHRVIVGNAEVSPGVYRTWFVVHLVLVSVLAALAGWLVWRRAAARRAAAPAATPAE